MSENISDLRIGSYLLILGILGAIINIGLIVWAFILSGEYHSVDTSLSLWFTVSGVALIQIERILDNQIELKKLLLKQNLAGLSIVESATNVYDEEEPMISPTPSSFKPVDRSQHIPELCKLFKILAMNDQRVGQTLFNAMTAKWGHVSDRELTDKFYNIENGDLFATVQEFCTKNIHHSYGLDYIETESSPSTGSAALDRTLYISEICAILQTLGENDYRIGQSLYNAASPWLIADRNELKRVLYSLENDDLLKLLQTSAASYIKSSNSL